MRQIKRSSSSSQKNKTGQLRNLALIYIYISTLDGNWLCYTIVGCIDSCKLVTYAINHCLEKDVLKDNENNLCDSQPILYYKCNIQYPYSHVMLQYI